MTDFNETPRPYYDSGRAAPLGAEPEDSTLWQGPHDTIRQGRDAALRSDGMVYIGPPIVPMSNQFEPEPAPRPVDMPTRAQIPPHMPGYPRQEQILTAQQRQDAAAGYELLRLTRLAERRSQQFRGAPLPPRAYEVPFPGNVASSPEQRVRDDLERYRRISAALGRIAAGTEFYVPKRPGKMPGLLKLFGIPGSTDER